MKHSLILTTLLASSLLVTGCSEESNEGDSVKEPNNSSNQQTDIPSNISKISGKTTLSVGIVCLDSNLNDTCDEHENSVETEVDGSFVIEKSSAFTESDQLLALDGYNLVLEENNRHKLLFKTKFNGETNNINMMTTRITSRMVEQSLSFKDALVSLAADYGLDAELITKHSVDIPLLESAEGKLLFTKIHALETAIGEKGGKSLKIFFPFPDDIISEDPDNTTDTDLSDDEAQDAVDNSSEEDIDFDSYLDSLKAYIDEAIQYLSDLISGLFTDDESASEDTTDNSTAVNATRAQLNGNWFLFNDQTNETSCAVVDAQNNITIYGPDDSNDELALEFDETTQALTLLYGWTEVDTLQLESFNNNRFTASYSSGILSATKESTVESCKKEIK
jgi:hypothetical protein